MALIADDFLAWLVVQLADADRKGLARVVFGNEQERALHRRDLNGLNGNPSPQAGRWQRSAERPGPLAAWLCEHPSATEITKYLALWLLDARQARRLRVGSKILRVKSVPAAKSRPAGCAPSWSSSYRPACSAM
jgi:hypothetical protein